MSNKIADARRSLIRAKESAEQRLIEIEKERREIRASLKSLEGALKALGGSNKTKTADKRQLEQPSHQETEHPTDTR